MTSFINEAPSIREPVIKQQPTINHRVLLSLQEAAKIIGTKGVTISKIRNDNNVKIGISEKVPGCSDRILSCAGNIINVSNALGDVIDVLNKDKNVVAEKNEDGTIKKHHFHFLNNILPPPSIEEIKDVNQLNNIGNIKIIIINSHLSSIIGKGGAKIKSLIEKHGVKIVASKDFLPDSNERILEIQGFPGSITNTLIDISEILLNDIDINFATERRYYPHLNSNNRNSNNSNNSHNSIGSSQNPQFTNSNHSNNYNRPESNMEDAKSTVLVPESYVGALVGRQGNRIAHLRKYTKTKIIIDKESMASSDPDMEAHRFFRISGSSAKNVLLAESMIMKNVETEIERRRLRLERNELDPAQVVEFNKKNAYTMRALQDMEYDSEEDE